MPPRSVGPTATAELVARFKGLAQLTAELVMIDVPELVHSHAKSACLRKSSGTSTGTSSAAAGLRRLGARRRGKRRGGGRARGALP